MRATQRGTRVQCGEVRCVLFRTTRGVRMSASEQKRRKEKRTARATVLHLLDEEVRRESGVGGEWEGYNGDGEKKERNKRRRKRRRKGK